MIEVQKFKVKPSDDQFATVINHLGMFRAKNNHAINERTFGYELTKMEGNYCDIYRKNEACPLTCSISRHGVTAEPGVEWRTKSKTKTDLPENGVCCDIETRDEQGVSCPIGWEYRAGSAKSIQTKNLPVLKKLRPWYKEPSSTALQQILIDVEKAFTNFFRGKAGYPQTKSRSQYKTFRLTSAAVEWTDDAIRLAGIGWMKHFNNRQMPKYDNKDKSVSLKSATVSLEADGLYVSMTFDHKKVPDLSPIAIAEIVKVIGIDMGLTKYAHCSDGEQFDNPRFATTKKARRQLRIRSRRLSRKKKGSKNREKERQRLARTHQNTTRKRDDFLWKLAKKLVDKVGINGCLVLEDLNVSGMMARCKPVKLEEDASKYAKNGQSRKKGLNRSIADASWGKFFTILEHMCQKNSVYFLQVNPRNSSNTCPECGTVDKESRDKEKFICTHCGYMGHADIGAAQEIRRRGIEELGLPEEALS